jgi:hypothetical protein
VTCQCEHKEHEGGGCGSYATKRAAPSFLVCDDCFVSVGWEYWGWQERRRDELTDMISLHVGEEVCL